jgi:small-conductance mechanosensitive channel
MTNRFIENIEYIGLFIGIILVTILVAYLFNRFYKRLIKRSTEDMRNDPTNYLFLRHAITTVVYIVGFSLAIYMMPDLRTLASSLLAGAGILAVAVGFASQHALANIISGILIVLYKPFRVNDQIRLREFLGVIEDITLRHVVIRDYENRRIIIPNSLISNEIIINAHFNDDRICKWIDISISYESNLAKAKEIIREEIEKHPMLIDPRTEQQIAEGVPMVPVKVLRLNQSSVDLRGWAWANNAADAFALGCDVYEAVKLRIDAEEDIQIPYPHREIVGSIELKERK